MSISPRPGRRASRQEVVRIDPAMENVTDGAGKINEALRIVEDIAERSNLLSLNAPLEAAGFGEKGRRFVVVAQQITRLSSRSSGSAKRIGTLRGKQARSPPAPAEASGH